MHLIDYLLLIGLAMASGMIFLWYKPGKNTLKLLLSFSGAYLFALALLHLIPELYQSGQSSFKTGIFILIGFILQVILEVFSEGIEHGHVHVHKHQKNFPLLMMISLSIHSLLEGMPLSCRYDGILHLKVNPFLLGIILHNIPIAFSLMSMLMLSGLSKRKALFWLGVFSIMAPVGSVLSFLLQQNLVHDLSEYYTLIMAIVIGIFLHISTTIMFESTENHRFNLLKIIIIVLGAITAISVEYF